MPGHSASPCSWPTGKGSMPKEKALGLSAEILGPLKGWEEGPPLCRTDCGSTLVLNEQVGFSEMLTHMQTA